MQRIQSFDLARGFTVLFMPSIHVMMLYSTPVVQQSLLGHILAFIAEFPGAQLLMLLMGVSFNFSKRISLQRALNLFLIGYALNFFKFIVPLGLNLLPEKFLIDLGQNDKSAAITFFLFLGDILHFAGFAYIILYFIIHSSHYHYRALFFTLAILLLAPLFWDVHTGIGIIDYIFSLIGGHPPYCYFPLIPWLVYPLVGLSVGYFIKKYRSKIVMKKLFWIGLLLLLVSLVLPKTVYNNDWLSFYRTKAPDTIFHLGFVLLWLAIFHWIAKNIPANSFFKLLKFCSRNITSIYIIQWIIICWCIAFTGYLALDLSYSLCWMAGITLDTILLAYLIKRSDEKSQKNI